MTASPRALFAIATVLTLSLFTPPVAASDCIEVRYSDFASGLRVIANAGNTIALGFTAMAPGDGAGYVLLITPSLCTGIGIGLGGADNDPTELLDALPPLIPLP